jgi:hypothetical protein
MLIRRYYARETGIRLGNKFKITAQHLPRTKPSSNTVRAAAQKSKFQACAGLFLFWPIRQAKLRSSGPFVVSLA